MPHVSTGDLFRENLKHDTELGRKARSFMEAGELVPDELVLEMLFDRVSRPDCGAGYLLDGFPRTLPQAEALEARLGDGLLIAPCLEVDEELLVRRTAGRLQCKACGNIQNTEYSPPAREGVCDACGGELYQRPDDRPEVVRERLRVYREQTAPVAGFYESRGSLVTVDGGRAPDVVFSDLLSIVQESGCRTGGTEGAGA
jgi:adenylate kinase